MARVLSPEEVRAKNRQFIKECREELLRAGVVSKGFRVPRDRLLSCFKQKWLQYKRELLMSGKVGA